MQKARDALETEPWHLDPRRLPARPSLCLLHFAFGFCLTLPQVWTKRCVTAGREGPAWALSPREGGPGVGDVWWGCGAWSRGRGGGGDEAWPADRGVTRAVLWTPLCCGRGEAGACAAAVSRPWGRPLAL